ncbi:helix-turn-helix transcriptional regulator [Pseudomonas sp. NPDC090755]|uniref:helix-turn-helix transcriptional regulator n=1 Tax=Pseudomonas sp. NPDC090755 TaxID=3364481 RepID=UPI00383BEC21
MISAATDRFMRIDEVIHVTGLARNTIYRRMREGTFPQQIRLGPNSVAWLQSSISEWMSSLVVAASSVDRNSQ